MLILGWGMFDSPMLDDFEYLHSNENGGNFEIVFYLHVDRIHGLPDVNLNSVF